MLVRFRDRVFARDGQQWYVWEPHWDSMRPIEGFGWNGRDYEILDSSYTLNPLSETFGYGSLRKASEKLTDRYIEELEKAEVREEALIGTPTWFRDRWVVLANPCVSPTTWRKHCALLRSRPRTCRNPPRGRRTTKRILPRDKRCA